MAPSISTEDTAKLLHINVIESDKGVKKRVHEPPDNGPVCISNRTKRQRDMSGNVIKPRDDGDSSSDNNLLISDGKETMPPDPAIDLDTLNQQCAPPSYLLHS